MADERGAFIWYELMTDDVAAARDFYQAVVGWVIDPEGHAIPGGGTYRMIRRSDGREAGGLLEIGEEMKAGGAKAVWLGYVHHPDVDAAVAAFTAAGGAVHMPAMDMPDVGRMAMVADAQGAMLYVMTPVPPPGDPDATSDTFDYALPQHFRWNELWTSDPEAATAHYTGVFGWTQENSMPMPVLGDAAGGVEGGEMGDYRFIEREGGMIGAIGQAQPSGEGSRWQYFAGVDDIDRACKAVTAHGGTLIGEPQQIPGGEYSVYAHDPSGATIGLVGPRR